MNSKDSKEEGWKITFDRHHNFIVDRISPDFGLIDKLYSNSAITEKEKAEIEAENVVHKRSENLIKCLGRNLRLGMLIQGLRESDQKHLVKYLENDGNYNNKFGGEWPLTENEILTIKSNYEPLIDLIETSDLTVLLYSTGVINKRERDFISSKSPSYEKNKALLEIIRRGSLRSYWQTIRCLHQSNQSHIAGILEKGGVAVRGDANLEVENMDIGRLEEEIALQINCVLRNRPIEELNLILDQLSGLKLIAAKKGHSVSLYFLCSQSNEVDYLEKLATDGQLKEFIEDLFNRLIKSQETIKITLKWAPNVFVRCREAIQDCVYHEKRSTESRTQTKIEDSPLEMLDAILLKTVRRMMVIHSSEEFGSFDDLMYHVLNHLRTISSLWDCRLHSTKWVKIQLQRLRNTSKERDHKTKKSILDCYAIFVKDVKLSAVRVSLIDFKVVKVEELNDIFNKSSNNQSLCRAFLDHLFIEGHPLAFLAMQQLLDGTKADILDYMNGKKSCPMTEGSKFLSNNEIKEIISTEDIYDQLMADMDPDRLGDWLKQERIIAIKEWQENIASSVNIKDQRHSTLEYLSTISHPRAYIILRQVLIQDNPKIATAIDNATSEAVKKYDILNQIVKHREFLMERMDSEFGLLRSLRANGILTNEELEDIKTETTQRRLNGRLLDCISMNSSRNSADLFIEALKETNQGHLVNYMISDGVYDSKFAGDWPLTEADIRSIDSSYAVIIRLLDTDGILTILSATGVINSKQRGFISHKPTSHGSNKVFLDILRKTSLRNYKETIRCLRKSNQNHIADILETGEDKILTASKGSLCIRNSQALLKKILISAVEDENENIVKLFLDEFFNTSAIFVKSWSSDSHPKKLENKFEIWRDAMYIAMEKDSKHSEKIMKLLLDCDIIWSLDTKIPDLLLHRLNSYEKKVDDKELRLIEILLKFRKININARDEEGRTVLHLAKEEKLTSLLIRYGADVNKKDDVGKTPLMLMSGIRVSILETILKETRTLVDLDAVDNRGRTALMIAAIDNQPDAVELLLNAGASVNLSDHLGFTALHHALCTRFDRYDHFPRNSEELKKRKEIFTLLFDAIDEERYHQHWNRRNKTWNERRMKIIEILLERPDIDMNALSFEMFSPLDIAEGWIPEIPSSIKNALREKGAVLNVFRETVSQPTSEFHLDVRCRLVLQRLLHRISAYDEELGLPVDLFEKRLLTLIDTFQDQIVSGKDQQGRNALHLVAISFSFVSVVNRNTVSYWRIGNYGLHLAKAIVKKLIKIGCDVNETDIYGRTPLFYADKILKTLLISHGADASIKDKDGNSAIEEIPQQSYNKSSDIVKAVIKRKDETYFLLLMNNRQMEIEVQCADSQIRAADDREFQPKAVPRLLWGNNEYAFRHPLVEEITKKVTDLISDIAKEIERLDPRFEIKAEFVGSSNEGTRLYEPDEFDFCFVLTKISELCEVSLSPELPTGFVRLKRKPTKVDEASDFDCFFGKDGILNTEKLKCQFSIILSNVLVNIESQQSLDWILQLLNREFSDNIKKVSNMIVIKPLNFTAVKHISIDIVPCIHVDGWWPDEAISSVSDETKTFGANLIFDDPRNLYPWFPYFESCARILFSKAESDMVKQSCNNAREAYMIGKTMVEESDSESKYTLKNCLLYCIEALTPTSEKASKLGLSLEELESKFHQMDRYLWLKCLMKCHLEFVLQDFCPCYLLRNFNSPIGKEYLKRHSLDWMTDSYFDFPKRYSEESFAYSFTWKKDDDRIVDEVRRSYFPELCRKAYALYRCTSNDISETCYQSPAPDLLLERFDRNQLIASLCEIAYK